MIKINELFLDDLIYPKDQTKYTDYGFYKIRVVYLTAADRYDYRIFDDKWSRALNTKMEIYNMILPNFKFEYIKSIKFENCILPEKFFYMFDDRASFKNCIFK